MEQIKKIKELLNNQRFIINYSRMWPYVKPFWFRALCSMLICIPIGSLDAVIALALKPYMDLVMVEKSVTSPWYRSFYIYSRRVEIPISLPFNLGWRKYYKWSKVRLIQKTFDI